jgi:hypothetical protein
MDQILYNITEHGVEEIIEEEEDEVHPDEEEPEFDSTGKGETEEDIDLMNNNKAPGEDGIQAESIKYGEEALKEEMYNLVKKRKCHKNGALQLYTLNTRKMTKQIAIIIEE